MTYKYEMYTYYPYSFSYNRKENDVKVVIECESKCNSKAFKNKVAELEKEMGVTFYYIRSLQGVYWKQASYYYHK